MLNSRKRSRESYMRLRRFFEEDVLIRLSENGFVETIRCFGLTRRLFHEAGDLESIAGASDEMLVRLPVKRDEIRRADAANE